MSVKPFCKILLRPFSSRSSEFLMISLFVCFSVARPPHLRLGASKRPLMDHQESRQDLPSRESTPKKSGQSSFQCHPFSTQLSQYFRECFLPGGRGRARAGAHRSASIPAPYALSPGGNQFINWSNKIWPKLYSRYRTKLDFGFNISYFG